LQIPTVRKWHLLVPIFEFFPRCHDVIAGGPNRHLSVFRDDNWGGHWAVPNGHPKDSLDISFDTYSNLMIKTQSFHDKNFSVFRTTVTFFRTIVIFLPLFECGKSVEMNYGQSNVQI